MQSTDPRLAAHGILARDEHVPGLLARRLAQIGPKAVLRRRVAEADANDLAALSVDLLLHDLASDGDVDTLRDKPFRSRRLVRFKRDSFATAALNGHGKVVVWMMETAPSLAVATPTLLEQVAALGHVHVAQLLASSLFMRAPTLIRTEEAYASIDDRAPLEGDAASAVFLSSVLRVHIYSFRPRPSDELTLLEDYYEGDRQTEDVRGLLMRIALGLGDLVAVKQVYLTAELLRFAGPPKFSLTTAIHDAAVEGHLDALEWLHSQPGVGRSRPDTMAAAVRTGRSDVVRWLHKNAPESALSMSAAPLIDAARWGLLDVIRTCHELNIPAMMVDPSDRTTWSQDALNAAIENDHTTLVRWLTHEFQAVGSTNAVKQAIVNGNFDMMRTLHEIDGLPVHCVDACICEIANTPALSKLTEFTLTHKLLSDAGAVQIAEVLFRRAWDESVLSLTRKLIASYGSCIEPILLAAIRLCNDQAATSILSRAELAPQTLVKALQVTFTNDSTTARLILIEYEIQRKRGQALPLVASHGELSLVQKVFPYRTSDQAVAALSRATSLEIASFLIRNEDEHFTEAILLAYIPSCLSAAFVRFFLKHGRCEDTTMVQCFAPVLENDRGPLTVEEIKAVQVLRDTALNDFVKKHSEALISFKVFDVAAAHSTWPDVYQYLISIGVALPARALDAAISTGSLRHVECLIRQCGMSVEGVSASCVRFAASQESHADVIEYLYHHSTSKSSHSFRVGIRMAYEDALENGDEATAQRVQLWGTEDLSQLHLALVVDEGHAKLATTLAQGAPHDTVVKAIERATEGGHWAVVTALLDTRRDIHVELGRRAQLAGFAFRAGELEVAKKFVSGVTKTTKKSKLATGPRGMPRQKRMKKQ